MNTPLKFARSKALMLSGASALALIIAHPAAAQTLSGLRGALGATGGASPTGGAASAGAAIPGLVVTPAMAQQRTAQSTADLNRAVAALNAQLTAQAAANSAAKAAVSNVPNGLTPGGLVPDSGLGASGVANQVTTWINANTPTQTTANGQTTVTILQTAQKAILNWSSFNVGQNTEVYFNQSAGTQTDGSNAWVVLNRVNDPSARPSQILGQIKAEGSVYLINHNGVVFGGSSQVNVNSLVASSLCLFSCATGDANTPGTSNYRFLNGGIGDLNSTNYQTEEILFTSDTATAGAITIDQGSEITGGKTGLILMAAPNITNSGSIAVAAGQVALIAGIGVSYTYNSAYTPGQALPYNDGSSTFLIFSNSGTLTDGHGNDITPVGTLDNEGLISTPRGDITMLGGAVEQNGIAVATTSVNQPGSIVVDGAYETGFSASGAAGGYTGAVTFGPQAITAILPDTNGATLSSDATSLAPWQSVTAVLSSPLPIHGFGAIDITGQAIDFQGGSLTYAPGQRIDANTQVVLDPRNAVAGSGRLFLEDGATLDVSGIADTELPDSYNLLTVKLAGNELADDPLQQDGFLYGKTITVDMRDTGVNAETGESWVGTPLANLTGYANLQQNSIDQLLVNAGTISLGANEVVTAPGSTINLMGGYIHFLGGVLDTSNLVDASGHIVNVSQANPLDAYIGFAGQTTDVSMRWGIVQTYTNTVFSGGTYEPDYIQGGNAGSLSINSGGGGVGQTPLANSGAAVLDATLLGGALAGARQVESGALPNGGSFTFSGVLPIEIGDPSVLSASSLQALSPPPGFTMSSPLLATNGSVYANGSIINSTALDNAGLSTISILSAGSIVEDAGASLAVQPGGSISLGGVNGLDAGGINILGDLTARAGSISIASNTIQVGPQSVLDVSGLFVNDAQLAPGQLAAPTLVNGGSIVLEAGPSITLAAGSLLDLEGGGRVLPNGRLQTLSSGAPAGSGGNLTLATYTDQLTPPTTNGLPPTASVIALDGTIKALGMSGGGALTLQAVALQIGGDPATTPSYAYYFDPVAWGDLGFASFNLSSILQSEVPAGATVSLHHQNLLPNYSAIAAAPTGADPADYATPGSLTGTLLSPTNLSITAGLEEADNYNTLTPSGQDYAQLDAGAQIVGDPGASVSMASYAMTSILGSIVAPGGNIALTVYPQAEWYQNTSMGPLYLGASAKLDVSGTTVINPLAAPVNTADGYVIPYTGEILAGGTVSLTSNQSPILIAPGAVINVSGASGALDVVQAGSGPDAHDIVTREPEWSNAGQINIKALNLLLEGSLLGFGGAPGASGATLTISSGADANGDTANLIMVQDTAAALAAANVNFNLATYVPAVAPTTAGLASIPGLGATTLLVGADKIDATKTGIDSLILGQGAGFGFAGNVTLNLNDIFQVNSFTYTAAKAGNINWQYGGPVGSTNGASLTVNAKYIQIGDDNVSSTNLPFFPSPAGYLEDGTMTLNADQIDIAGYAFTQNIGQTNFFSTGEIRLLPAQYAPGTGGINLVGAFVTVGNVAFKATDIYPATDTVFAIDAEESARCYQCAAPRRRRPRSALPTPIVAARRPPRRSRPAAR
jgi:filamentous hemagglutinin family protein